MPDTPETPDVHIHTIEEAKAADEDLVKQDIQNDLRNLQKQLDVA